jgi:hypothetical protein
MDPGGEVGGEKGEVMIPEDILRHFHENIDTLRELGLLLMMN